MLKVGENMIELGLIGKNISHSKSQFVYEELLKKKISYTLFDYPTPTDLPTLESLFEKVQGISITAPYKKDYAGEVVIEGDVADLGIINCIRKNGPKFEATNTDYLAVVDFLQAQNFKSYTEIILLGSGSMAEITIKSMEKLGLNFKQISRSTDSNFSNLDLTKISNKKKVFVINSCAREYVYSGPLNSEITFWDYNYGHKTHADRFSQSSTLYIDGMDLLVNQAKHALSFWGHKLLISY